MVIKCESCGDISFNGTMNDDIVKLNCKSCGDPLYINRSAYKAKLKKYELITKIQFTLFIIILILQLIIFIV